MSQEATSTVVRVVRLLQCVAELGGEISVKEFAQRLSLPPSTVHRLLKLLMTQGLIEQRAATQRYRAGRELFRVSSLITRQVDLEEIARPILDALRDACHETCYFAIYLPASRRFVGTVVARSPHPLGYHFEPLMEQKVAWGAVGRCMLAYLPDEVVAKAVAEAEPSPAGNPPPNLKDIKIALKDIRERGYACAEGEIFPEAIGFARVVFDADGNVMGSLGITMPMIRYKPAMHKQLASLVMGKAKELSKALGYREPAEGRNTGCQSAAEGAAMSDAFRLIEEGAVLVLEIDRAQTKNSLKLVEMIALGETLASERVQSARCLVIRGAGAAFCSGRDVREIDPHGEDAHEILRDRIGPVLQRLYTLPAPTISSVRGPALGFGLGLALACDITIASDDAIFGSPFRRIGAVLDSGGHYFFQQRLGRHRAAELVFTGRMLNGRQAADLGLINETVPADALAARTAELAALIASGPTAAFRATKTILAEDRSFADVLELEARYQKEVTRGPDGQEGLAAFRERRSPVFKGT